LSELFQFCGVAFLLRDDGGVHAVTLAPDAAHILLARSAESAARKLYWRLPRDQRQRCIQVSASGVCMSASNYSVYSGAPGLFTPAKGPRRPAADALTAQQIADLLDPIAWSQEPEGPAAPGAPSPSSVESDRAGAQVLPFKPRDKANADGRRRGGGFV